MRDRLFYAGSSLHKVSIAFIRLYRENKSELIKNTAKILLIDSLLCLK